METAGIHPVDVLRATLDHFLLRFIPALQQEARRRVAVMAMTQAEAK
jgi:hypothetical protein